MTILDNIITDKHKEVALKKQAIPIKQLEQSAIFDRSPFSLSKSIRKGSGIIAEHKRRSPSKSIINTSCSVQDIALGYARAQASGISVLTDGKYFGGSLDDLVLTRASVDIPILRKEFIVDEYQIIEAKAYGADAILLIAAVLSQKQILQFSRLAHNLGMEVLCEAHNLEEVELAIVDTVDMIGINNRNLKTFEVSIQTSIALATQIPDGFVKVSESGISDIDTIDTLKSYGYQGFLMGETFMKTENPGKSASEFIKSIQKTQL